LKEALEDLHRQVIELKTENVQLKSGWQENREWFNKIFHAAANPMAITRIRDGLIVDVNESFLEFSGFHREELVGRTTSECGLWAEAKQRDTAIQTLKASGKVSSLEILMRSKSGEIFTAIFSGDTITVNSEPCMLSMAINITERKKAEDGLKRSEEKYRILVENSLQGLAIIQDLRIVYCNHTFAAFLGYSVDALLSMNPRQVLSLVALNDREILAKRHRERLDGKPVPSRYEHRAVKRDGTFIWVEALITVTEYDGKPAVQATYIDISGRKEAEQKISASKDHLDAILNHISDPIFVLDRQHRIIHINDAGCAFSGMRRENLIGMTTHQYLPKDRAEEMWRQEEEVYETGKECVTEDYLPDTQGNMHALIVKKCLLVDTNGNKELIGVARDITEYKNLQAQMLQVQKMEAIGALASGIASDFNNLLSIIKGYVDLVIEERAADTDLRQDLEKALQACQRGETLTTQLMAFSQTHRLNMEIINLNEIIRGMTSLIRRLIGEAIHYEAMLDPDLAFINSDPDQVRQIITNLVVNAQAAMPEGGRLIIQTANVELDEPQAGKHPEAKAGSYVLLAITDDGMGMDDHIKAHLFEPFFTTKGEGKGTGLGLSTVYGIVKQSNGFIEVESRPGSGTKFLIYFPPE